MMNSVVMPSRRIITPDMRQGIARAFQSGKTFEEIRTMFAVSNTSIRRILDENKIPYAKSRRVWTDDEKKRAERYAKLGWDANTIAKQLGRSAGSVHAYFVKYGPYVPYSNTSERKIRPWTTAEAVKCQEMVANGMKLTIIAKELGRSEGSVSGWISDNLRNTKHNRAKPAHRLDGTPMPENKKEETPVKPSLAEQIENAKNKMADESGLTIEESHTKVIRGKMGVYTLRVDKNLMDFSLNAGVFTKEEFGALANEMAKVYALM